MPPSARPNRTRFFPFLALLLLLFPTLVQADSFKFAVLCDTRSDADKNGENGVNVAAVQAVCRNLAAQGAEFVLAPGDLICGNVKWYNQAGTPPASGAQYSSFLQAAAAQGVGLPGTAKIELYPVRGNHESYHDLMSQAEVMAAWQENVGGKLPPNGPAGESGFTYSFVRHNMLFAGLDQYVQADASEKSGITYNRPWLRQQLQATPRAERVFIFGHTPAFAANHKDCLAEDPQGRDELLRGVKKGRGLYFCGHDHFYARGAVPVYAADGKTVRGEVQQVITPSGAPFLTGSKAWNGQYPDPAVQPRTFIDRGLGYQLVTVDGPRITVQFIATLDGSNAIRDSQGATTYTYNSDWQHWNFVVMDQYSLPPLPKKSTKQAARKKL